MKKFRFKSAEEKRIEQLEWENANLIFQNAMQDMTIQMLQNENAEMMFRLANVELREGYNV